MLAWGKRLGALALVLTLGSCYIPDKYKAELRLSRYGDYAITYDGDLLYVPILHDYADNKIKPEEEESRQENIRRDMARDIAFKKIEPRGKGRFTVHYERMGRLGRVELVALVRRDARILSLKSFENGAIGVAANALKPGDAQTLAKLGIEMKGEFRITTDANVVEHNAAEVRPFGAFKVYVWRMDGPFAPSPKLIMIRDTDPERPLPERPQELKTKP
ncbi:MAG: hypothetical protein ACM31L_14845 [Actinomycetota bacterium]